MVKEQLGDLIVCKSLTDSTCYSFPPTIQAAWKMQLGASAHGGQTAGVNILAGIQSHDAERTRLSICIKILSRVISAGNRICGQRRRQPEPAQDCLEFCLAWPAE